MRYGLGGQPGVAVRPELYWAQVDGAIAEVVQAQQIAALVAKDGFLARLDRLARSGAEIRMGMALGNLSLIHI